MPRTWTLPHEPNCDQLRNVEDNSLIFTKVREGVMKGLWRSPNGGYMDWPQLLGEHELERVLPPEPGLGSQVIGRNTTNVYFRRRDHGSDHGLWVPFTGPMASFDWDALHDLEGAVTIRRAEDATPIEDPDVRENARLRAKVQELRTALDRERATRMDAEKEIRDKNRMLDAQAAQLATIRRVVGGNV